jgi:telomerase reverse transcriptase
MPKYAMTKFAEVSEPHLSSHPSRGSSASLKHRIRYHTTSASTKRISSIANEAHARLEARRRRHTVYVGALGQQVRARAALLPLLDEHVRFNVVKMGRRFYRQTRGVPQGSVVAGLLCSLLYGQLERETLAFVRETPGAVLLRLVDDFLLISTDKAAALRFLRVMHAGVPQFGVQVKLQKSLVNFDAEIEGVPIEKVTTKEFPYCGVLIDTMNMDIIKDMSRVDSKSHTYFFRINPTNH